ncbi:MAG TPA: hypothetical protein VHL57_11945, partial [Flavobacteriales bacterium]|nr:hypothetical protein [Flavobacteriales bacterium]
MIARSARSFFVGLSAVAFASVALAQTSFEKIVRADLFSIDGMALVAQAKQSTGRSLLVSNATIEPANGADMLVQVFDARGNVLHDLVIGNLDYHDVCKEVAQLGSAYYLTGFTRSIDTSAAHTFTAFVIKLDTALNFIWQKNYILPGQELYANAITPTMNSQLLIAGQIYDGSDFHTCVMRADTLGNLIWIKQYALDNSEGFTCIRELPGNEIMLSGSITFGFELSVPIVLKLDAQGTPVWGKYFNYPPVSFVERSAFQFIRSISNTEILLAGHTDVMGAGGQDVYVVRIDSSGAVMQAHTYGGDQFEEPYGLNFDQHLGELVVEGATGSFDPQFMPRGMSLRILPNGTLV